MKKDLLEEYRSNNQIQPFDLILPKDQQQKKISWFALQWPIIDAHLQRILNQHYILQGLQIIFLAIPFLLNTLIVFILQQSCVFNDIFYAMLFKNACLLIVKQFKISYDFLGYHNWITKQLIIFFDLEPVLLVTQSLKSSNQQFNNYFTKRQELLGNYYFALFHFTVSEIILLTIFIRTSSLTSAFTLALSVSNILSSLQIQSEDSLKKRLPQLEIEQKISLNEIISKDQLLYFIHTFSNILIFLFITDTLTSQRYYYNQITCGQNQMLSEDQRDQYYNISFQFTVILLGFFFFLHRWQNKSLSENTKRIRRAQSVNLLKVQISFLQRIMIIILLLTIHLCCTLIHQFILCIMINLVSLLFETYELCDKTYEYEDILQIDCEETLIRIVQDLKINPHSYTQKFVTLSDSIKCSSQISCLFYYFENSEVYCKTFWNVFKRENIISQNNSQEVVIDDVRQLEYIDLNSSKSILQQIKQIRFLVSHLPKSSTKIKFQKKQLDFVKNDYIIKFILNQPPLNPFAIKYEEYINKVYSQCYLILVMEQQIFDYLPFKPEFLLLDLYF